MITHFIVLPLPCDFINPPSDEYTTLFKLSGITKSSSHIDIYEDLNLMLSNPPNPLAILALKVFISLFLYIY